MQLQFSTAPQVIRASKVNVPLHMKNRASTGIAWFDEALGSPDKPGYIIGSVFIIASEPGLGKSTIMRQMCSMLPAGEALYNSGEECFEQISMSLEDRHFEADFDLSNYREINDLLEAVRKGGYKMVVCDSLQNLYSATDHSGNPLTGAPGSKKQIVCVAEKIAMFCKETLITFMLICHSTKAGDFSGPQALAHVVDGAIKITCEQGLRVLTMEKNRWGLAGANFYLGMSEHGFTRQDAPEGAMDAGGSRRGTSKMDVAKRIKAENPGIDKEDFIGMLIEETGCGESTASTYFYSAK